MKICVVLRVSPEMSGTNRLRQVAKRSNDMTNPETNDLSNDNAISTKATTAPVSGYVQGRIGVGEVLKKELGAGSASVSFIQKTYPEMVSLKLARGKKDPEHSGTIGYLVHKDGSLEELDNGTKLVDVGWGQYTESAFVVAYLNLTGITYRVYGGAKMAELFGVTEGSDAL